MNAEKAVKRTRISVTVPEKEVKKLKSFPYFASFIVSCLLEEVFKRVTVGELTKEINVEGALVSERLERLKGCIAKAFSEPDKRKQQRVKQDYWKGVGCND